METENTSFTVFGFFAGCYFGMALMALGLMANMYVGWVTWNHPVVSTIPYYWEITAGLSVAVIATAVYLLREMLNQQEAADSQSTPVEA